MSKSIYGKLLAVMEAIDRIEKRGRNAAQSYDYLMAEDVIDEVRQEFIRQKMVLIPACTSQEVVKGETKNGGTQYLTTANMTFTLACAETGDTVQVPWQGQGQDSGDKGLYKAFTGADKYFLRNILLIPTRDDPENDGTPPKARTQQNRPTIPPAPPAPSPQKPANLPGPIGKPASPDIAKAAENAFGKDNVTVTDPAGEDKPKKDEPHVNKSKATEAITKTIAITAGKANVEPHAAATQFFGKPIVSLYDIGAKPVDYQPFLQHLNALATANV